MLPTLQPATRTRGLSLCVHFLILSFVLQGVMPAQSTLAGARTSTPAVSVQPQASSDPQTAFLRQGNLWLMNIDGSNQRQITSYPWGVVCYSWSPSGRYLLMLHGGRHWHWTKWQQSEPPVPQLSLYDVTTNELRDLLQVPSAMPAPNGRFPSWAVNADELMMEVAEQGGQFSIVRITLDGMTSQIGTYFQPPTCGGPDGPMTVGRDLLWEQEFGSPFARDVYQDIVWWADQQIAYVNTLCGSGIALDLESGLAVDHPSTTWLLPAPDGQQLLVQDYPLVGGDPAGLFDPHTRAKAPIQPGMVYAWGREGDLYHVTRSVVGESAFTSAFDNLPASYNDFKVEIWATSRESGLQRLVTTLDAFGTGVPTISPDGTAMIMGIIENPTDWLRTDSSQYTEYSPMIYAEHHQVVRIEIGSGEVTVLATNAYRPKLQAGAGEVASTPAPVPVTNASTETPPASGSDGWIAYTGPDGNIWLTTPDGTTHHQVTTDGSPAAPYVAPNWSPDGTMLAFSTRSAHGIEGNDVYLLRSGQITRIPNIWNCSGAAFTTDGTELAILCGVYRNDYPAGVALDHLQQDPDKGFVSLVSLDGSNWRVMTPFPIELNGFDTLWWEMLLTRDITVSIVDGAIMLNSIFFSSAQAQQLHLVSADGAYEATLDTPGDQGRIRGRFTASSDQILTSFCRGCYRDSMEHPNTSIVWMDRSGAIVETLYTLDPARRVIGFDLSPDGSRLALTTMERQTEGALQTGDLQIVDMPSGTMVPIGSGADVAWQPHPAEVVIPGGGAEPAPEGSTIALEPGANWIAYIGDDGNVWVMQPDGTDQTQVTTDGSIANGVASYSDPIWSHDGTTLAFSRPQDSEGNGGIWLFRDGLLAPLSNTNGCQGPAFSSDDQRLVYACSPGFVDHEPPPPDLGTNPLLGFVSSSALDGSDQRVEIAYSLDGTGVPFTPDGKARHYASMIDIRSTDGAMLVPYSGHRKAGAYLFATDGTMLTHFEMPGEFGHGLGPYDARFTPAGDQIIATWCSSGCFPHAGNSPVFDVVALDQWGTILERWTSSFPGQYAAGADMSPDGRQVIASYSNESDPQNVLVLMTAPGDWQPIGYGTQPSWQPDRPAGQRDLGGQQVAANQDSENLSPQIQPAGSASSTDEEQP
jgi:Tol biopolymer transport system component